MDQRSGDGRFIGRIENPRDRLLERIFQNFEMLDAKIASALNKIIQNSHFKKKVSLRGAECPKGESVSTRKTDRLHDLRLLSSYWCSQLNTVLELYDMEIHQKISMPNHQKLKTMVRRSTNQKLQLRNFDARHGKIETGAVVKNRKEPIGVEGGKGTCYQWKEKGQCSKGDKYSFRHESNDRAQQKPVPKAATLSEPSMTRGRSVSRKRSIKGKSDPGIILRQPCRYYLKGTCTRSPCEYGHPPECQFYKKKKETGWKAGDKCLFPHHKVDEQPNKKPKKSDHSQKKEKATTEMQWLL